MMRLRLDTLASRDRRAIRLGVALVAALLGWSVVVRPAWQRAADDARRLGAARTLLGRELGVLHDTASQRHQLDAVRARLGGESTRLLDSRDPLAASAELSATVRELMAQSGMRLQRTETLPNGDSAGVAVDASADGDFAAIMRFLRAVEHGDRLVRVERLAIDHRADVDQADVLALSVTLRAPTAAAAASAR